MICELPYPLYFEASETLTIRYEIVVGKDGIEQCVIEGTEVFGPVDEPLVVDKAEAKS